MSAAAYGSKPNIDWSGGASSVADAVELILDKGLAFDVFARVSLVGIEILTIDARATVDGVDSFVQYAEATNRLAAYTVRPAVADPRRARQALPSPA